MPKSTDDWFSPFDCVGITHNESSVLGSPTKRVLLNTSKFDESQGLWVTEYNEGDLCRIEGCCGRLTFSNPDNCSCHINPPCSSCMSTYLECKECGWEHNFDGEGKER